MAGDEEKILQKVAASLKPGKSGQSGQSGQSGHSRGGEAAVNFMLPCFGSRSLEEFFFAAIAAINEGRLKRQVGQASLGKASSHLPLPGSERTFARGVLPRAVETYLAGALVRLLKNCESPSASERSGNGSNGGEGREGRREWGREEEATSHSIKTLQSTHDEKKERVKVRPPRDQGEAVGENAADCFLASAESTPAGWPIDMPGDGSRDRLENTVKRLRDEADFALFLCGYFASSLPRSPRGESHYRAIGERAYLRAWRHCLRGQASQGHGQGHGQGLDTAGDYDWRVGTDLEAFHFLSSSFLTASDVLSELRDLTELLSGSLALGSSTSPGNLAEMERWHVLSANYEALIKKNPDLLAKGDVSAALAEMAPVKKIWTGVG